MKLEGEREGKEGPLNSSNLCPNFPPPETQCLVNLVPPSIPFAHMHYHFPHSLPLLVVTLLPKSWPPVTQGWIKKCVQSLEEIEKWLHLAKRGTQPASASRPVPCFYGEQGEILYPHQSLVYDFFFLQVYSQKLASGSSTTCSGVPEVIDCELLPLEVQNPTRECRGRRVPAVEYNL